MSLFFLFPKIKQQLKGTHHGDVEEVKSCYRRDDNQGCFEWWVQRWNRSVKVNNKT